MEEINNILRKNNIESIAILSPLYYGSKMAKTDLAALENYFGHVSDYSDRSEFTLNRLNFYDESHYRPFIAQKIIKEITHKDQSSDNNLIP